MRQPIGKTERTNRLLLTAVGLLLTAAGAFGLLRYFGMLYNEDQRLLFPALESDVVDARPWVLAISIAASALVLALMALIVARQLRRWSVPRHEIRQRSPSGARWAAVIPARAVEASFRDTVERIDGVVAVSSHSTADDAPSAVDAKVTVRSSADLRDLEPQMATALQRWGRRVLVDSANRRGCSSTTPTSVR